MSVARERGVGFGAASAIVIRKIADRTPLPVKRAVSQILTDAVMRSPEPVRREMLDAAQDPENLLQGKLKELRLVRDRLPETVVIIPDGSRRGAKELGLTIAQGYDLGARVLYDNLSVFHEFSEIKNIVIWAWSTDNETGRSHEQKMDVFGTIARYLGKYTKDLDERNCRITHVGRPDRLEPERSPLTAELLRAETKTMNNTGTNIILGIDWGEDYEDSLFARSVARSGIAPEDLTEEQAAKIRRGSMSVPEPDLVVRTSGEQRLSRLPYGNHAEIVVVPEKLTFVKPHHIAGALLEYTRRDIRKGK